MTGLEVEREPEVVLYLARHFLMLGATAHAIRVLQRARVEGLTSSQTLARDEAFAPVRDHPDFRREFDNAKSLERDARRALERTGGSKHLLG